MSLPPQFKSAIPDHLLHDLGEKDKYIIEQLSVMGQKSDWLIGETGAQSLELAIIKSETKATNGKIARAMLDIDALKKKDTANAALLDEVKKIVDFKHLIGKIISNKWFWVIFGIFSVGIIKIMTTEELRVIFFRLIGLG